MAVARVVRFRAKAVGQAARPAARLPGNLSRLRREPSLVQRLASVIRRPCPEPGRGRTAWRAEGVPLKSVRESSHEAMAQ